jgi:serine-type D-Ala-D-Ala carboxypeptidase/endopeptidase (penicillin-binding protein 4)
MPLVLAALLSAAAGSPTAADRLASAVEQQVRVGERVVAALGVEVIDVETGDEVYAHLPDNPRILASNTKLFTTAAALDALGPGYFFETRFLARGAVTDGTLAGDLAVIGGGDPNISGRLYEGDPYAVFRQWAAALKARDIHRVDGDLYLDHGMFEGPTIHPDWPARDRQKWYQAPISALSFSDNCLLVRIDPALRAGAPARVEVVPSLPLFKVENRARTSDSWRQHNAGVIRAQEDHRLTVFGSVYRNAGPLETWVAVPDPVEYFGAALRDALAEEGIEVTGRALPVERLPGLTWETVTVFRSDLLTTIGVTNKRSQNFYAESLLKVLGAERCGRGSWEAGIEAVAEFLERIGIPRGSYSMVDGSGLSRNNRFTPREVAHLLRTMYFHRYGREFLRSLPFSGEEDLSWRERLAEAPYAGNVFAKTGTIQGVSALSGYAKAGSGKLYAFSILCNDVGSTWAARRLQDRIVAAIIDNG